MDISFLFNVLLWEKVYTNRCGISIQSSPSNHHYSFNGMNLRVVFLDPTKVYLLPLSVSNNGHQLPLGSPQRRCVDDEKVEHMLCINKIQVLYYL